MMRQKIKTISILSIFLLSSIASAAQNPAQNERYENLELFQKVLHFVEANYVDEIKNKDLMYGAIKGMLETLDPHSNFLTGEVLRDMEVDTSGKFGGLGIEIGMKDNILTVIAPIEDTPAWRAGIKPNDRIVKINKESTKGMSLSDAVSRMRGKKGSPVILTIYRDGFDQVKDFSVKRDIIKVQSVKSEELEPGYGYVRLTNFNESAASDVKNAIEKLQKSGKLKGLIFDLRNNPGGLLDQAVDVSSLFLDDGAVVSTIGRDKNAKDVKYAKKTLTLFKELPLAVLVNSNTASASEIVAGALQDHQRAMVIGQPTFGKGSVQSVIKLGNELGLKLTIARYYTPSGRSIQEKGVQPDVTLEDYDPKLLNEAKRKHDGVRERDLRGHIVNPEAGSKEEREDFRREELESLSKKDSDRDSKKPSEEESRPMRFVAKEDFQVSEALNYLKSFDVFKRMGQKSASSK